VSVSVASVDCVSIEDGPSLLDDTSSYSSTEPAPSGPGGSSAVWVLQWVVPSLKLLPHTPLQRASLAYTPPSPTSWW
jgi:hypothetical protein